MKNVLITGGAGFIGSHLCEALCKEHNVTSLDNYFTGSTDNHVPGVRYIEGSTWDIDTLVDFKPDIIYHLGEYSRVEQSFSEPRKVHEFNIQGTFEVLEFALETNAKLVYAGSSTKFADTENYTPSPYAWSKASNTDLVKKYGEWFGLDYAITYFYNVYGPREISSGPYTTLIAKYLKLAKEGKNLPITLPGTQARNFTHIDDIISGLILVGNEGHGDEYGIGSNEAWTIQAVADLIAIKTGVEFTYTQETRGNRLSASVITKKTKDLGWAPTKYLMDYIDAELRNHTS